ncbi:peptidyl-prolyl cis-trans isomerase [Aulographum hederae CBS 113979]|uniref:peptidylprolyl isomerase n=1 Tax=Aulographum hederae CBS 113979 TaxID=1176131 RepID=A0A6G1GNV6_9PEZI|nr:peptidyl-prolyl cis-trans isomerase [Aulographum hederae CBS 113979]
MGVTKTVLEQGDGVNRPQKGDRVAIEYTGWLYQSTAPDNKGNQFDSSAGRGDLVTEIGAGRVIRGWDEGILGPSHDPSQAMSIGEKAILEITSDYAYGDRGFAEVIPPRSSLIFEVKLKAINGKTS